MYKPGYNDRTYRQLGNNVTGKDDEELKKTINDYDGKFMNFLVGMHNALNRDRISIDEVQSVSNLLQHMKQDQTDSYYEALVKPEASRGAKIPSTIPVPSSSFQLHSQTLITPNASGNAFCMFNPFYLNTSASNPVVQGMSTFFVNNHASLTGSGAPTANQTFAVQVGQTIPNVYNAYRVVSASIVVRYIGDLMSVKGVIGGAIVFDSNTSPTSVGTAKTELDKYGDFSVAMDSYYHQENLSLNGIRELYFPLDGTYEQYLTPGTGKNGFSFLIYIQDGVASAANYKVDIFVNYEALPDSTFLNYIPQSSCNPSDTSSKEEAIRAVQQNPIRIGEIPLKGPRQGQSSLWDKLKGSLGNVLPGIASIAASFLPGGQILAPLMAAGTNALQAVQRGRGVSRDRSYYDMVD